MMAGLLNVAFVLGTAMFIAWTFMFLTGLVRALRSDYVSTGRTGGLPDPLPAVTVIVPARNEQQNIAACIESLLRQQYPNFRVIVADDSSEDETAAMVERYAACSKQVELLRVSPLPEGWCGKAHAMTEAARLEAGTSDYILFTDADTVHSPASLKVAVSIAGQKGADLVSFLPKLKCVTFWEKVVMPSIASLISLFHNLRKVNDTSRPASAFANGQYLLIRSATYFSIGGHEVVRDKVLEDVEFARHIKQKGARIFVGTALDVFETRMYRNLGDIIEGWSKNFFGILGYSPARAVAAISVSLAFPLIPPLAAAAGLLCLAGGAAASKPSVLAACYLATVGYQSVLRAVGKLYPLHSIFAPLGGVVTACIIFKSFVAALSGKGIRWKGRTYKTGERGGGTGD